MYDKTNASFAVNIQTATLGLDGNAGEVVALLFLLVVYIIFSERLTWMYL